jgi:hypothetical protein
MANEEAVERLKQGAAESVAQWLMSLWRNARGRDE